MDFWIDIGITALLRALKNKKQIEAYADAIAKVYVTVESVAETTPVLMRAVQRQREKAGT